MSDILRENGIGDGSEGKTTRLSARADIDQVGSAPLLFSNHIDVRANVDEVFITFYLRQDQLAVANSEGAVETSLKGLITMILTPAMAGKLSKTLADSQSIAVKAERIE